MASAVVTTRVGRAGTLVLPREVQEGLHLREGDEVELTIRRASSSAAGDEPLLHLIAIGDGVEDGSENHDAYLYGRHS